MRSNLYLIIINLILLFILLIGNVKTTHITPLTTLNPDMVTAFTIHREDKNTLKLIKQDNQWKLELLENKELIDADNELINSLLKILNTPIHHSLQLSKQEWQKFSLQEPKDNSFPANNSQSYLDISSNVAQNNINTRIIFGQEESLSLLRYVRVDDQVSLINSFYYYLLFRDFQANIYTTNTK